MRRGRVQLKEVAGEVFVTGQTHRGSIGCRPAKVLIAE